MKTIIIGIAGGTGSGKSTFTKKLKKEFKDDVAVLYHDNYYRDQSDIPLEERRKTNYDHPDAMETELLIRQLMNLKAGKAVDCPVYDYTQHTRSDQVVRVEPKKVILLEGILVLADERLRDLLDIKVYVEADADERILRRIICDVKDVTAVLQPATRSSRMKASSSITILWRTRFPLPRRSRSFSTSTS